MEVRISLTETDLARLMAGYVVETTPNGPNGLTVKLALQDIGWTRMRAALEWAMKHPIIGGEHESSE